MRQGLLRAVRPLAAGRLSLRLSFPWPVNPGEPREPRRTLWVAFLHTAVEAWTQPRPPLTSQSFPARMLWSLLSVPGGESRDFAGAGGAESSSIDYRQG